MADRIDGYAQGIFEIARSEGSLETVENELFQFSQIFQGNEQLQVLSGNVEVRRAEYTTDVDINDLLSLNQEQSRGTFEPVCTIVCSEPSTRGRRASCAANWRTSGLGSQV